MALQDADDRRTATRPWCVGMESGADTGWVAHRLDRGDHAPAARADVYDQWVDRRARRSTRPRSAAFEAFGESLRRGQRRRRPAGHAHDALRRRRGRRCSTTRRAASCTARATSSPGSSPRTSSRSARNVGDLHLPGLAWAASTGARARRRRPRRDVNDTRTPRAVMEFIASDEFGGPWAEAGGWLSPHATFDPGTYSAEIDAAARRDGRRGRRVPLRRLGPDAGRGRCRLVLDRDGRLGRRRPELAEALADIDASWPEDAAGEEPATEEDAKPRLSHGAGARRRGRRPARTGAGPGPGRGGDGSRDVEDRQRLIA